MTHDYKRNGTTTLFAALTSWTGTVIGQCMPRHRHQEFLKFLRKLDREFPRELELHLIVDNYAHPQAPQCRGLATEASPVPSALHPDLELLAEPRRAVVPRDHQQAIRRGVFHSVPDLIAAIEDYLATYNQDTTPFMWTASVDSILEKIARARAALPQRTPNLSTQN